jgi:hypothetical protein
MAGGLVRQRIYHILLFATLGTLLVLFILVMLEKYGPVHTIGIAYPVNDGNALPTTFYSVLTTALIITSLVLWAYTKRVTARVLTSGGLMLRDMEEGRFAVINIDYDGG